MNNQPTQASKQNESYTPKSKSFFSQIKSYLSPKKYLPFLLSAAIASSGCTALFKPTPKINGNDYIRTTKQGTLETSVIEFEKENAKITLFNMIHISPKESDYYEQIKKRLKNYDIVLYEGITEGEHTLANKILIEPFKYPMGIGIWMVNYSTRKFGSLKHQNEGLNSEQKHKNKWINSDSTCAEMQKIVDKRNNLPVVFLYNLLTLPRELIISTLLTLPTPFQYVDKKATSLILSKKEYEKRFRTKLWNDLIEDINEDSKKANKDFEYEMMVDYRNNGLLKTLDKTLKKYRGDKELDIAIIWGAAHGSGIEKGLLEREFKKKPNKNWLKVD
ncbi:MAG: hypothetical protein ABIG37_00900 [Nanoarchaeota archaeon]|nr:hypothetical protein [Nanoarchaeota archaeon]